MDQLLQSLPEPLKSFVDQEVASGKYPDSRAFLVDLIAAERSKRMQETMESLIQEAYDSGEPTPWTQEDWSFIRAEVRNRLAQRQESEK